MNFMSIYKSYLQMMYVEEKKKKKLHDNYLQCLVIKNQNNH